MTERFVSKYENEKEMCVSILQIYFQCNLNNNNYMMNFLNHFLTTKIKVYWFVLVSAFKKIENNLK